MCAKIVFDVDGECRVLESIKARKRLPEARFAEKTLHMASERQPSVLEFFGRSSRDKNNDNDNDDEKKNNM